MKIQRLTLCRAVARGCARTVVAPILLTIVLTSCGTVTPVGPAARQVSLPLRVGWFEDRHVEYVTTDVSDSNMARDMGANHVPMLANAAPPAGSPPGARTAVDRVYMFPNAEQVNVFPSAPLPAGHGNASRAYSPLWRIVLVRWSPGRQIRELRSEEMVLDAEERGDVAITQTAIVANCPIIRSSDGTTLAGMR